MKDTSHILKNRLVLMVPVAIFVAFTAWWLFLHNQDLDATRNSRQLWGATYQILAYYGAFIGLFIAQKWGGYKSLLGRLALALSAGLFLQCFGQTYSSYYVFHYGVESPPYPAIGDIGFFGSVIAYIYAVVILAKVSGFKASFKEHRNKILSIFIPLGVLALSYFLFLKGYEFQSGSPITTFLDLGYPIFQALYVSVAVVALLTSHNVLGGLMKKPILLLIFALIFQYFSDCMFLYQASAGSWYVGNINDYLYAASYFIMTVSLIQLGRAFDRIKNS